ncbi:MAG TPA: tetratricopeptide repeat protein [Anaerolineales bacterium]|nr:tetratricopeptide repeat protein [Anaerolineales bacterium]
MSKRTRRRSNPWTLLFLVALIGGFIYLNFIVVPTIPSPFAVTPTATRSPESFVNEAEAYFAQGKMTQAIDSYKEAILADPQNPANFIALARVQIFAGQYDEAKINAENALLLNPDNANAYAMRAWALDYMGDYLEALAAVKKAIELDPTNALAYAFYAEILIDQGNYEDIETAISMSRKAQDLAPNNLETHRARGYVLYATGNYAEAIEEYKAAIAINDKLWDMHYSLGVAYKLTEEYDLAVQEMLTAVALNPTNPDILTEISRTHSTIGQFDKAIQYAEQALVIDPSSPRLHGNLGVMLYKGEEYNRAVDEFILAVRGGTTADGVAVQGLPLAPGRVADEYYTFYGWSLVRLNRCDEAVDIFYFIIQNIQDDQLAYYNATEGVKFCQDTLEEPVPEP